MLCPGPLDGGSGGGIGGGGGGESAGEGGAEGAADAALRAFYAHADATNDIFRLAAQCVAQTLVRARELCKETKVRLRTKV